jgi:serine/threonine protein kinase
MSDRRLRRYAIGDRIGPRHTVLGVIDDKRGRHPVYMAWDHRDWCPMACKVFRSAAGAEREGAILSSVAHPNVVRLLHRDGAALFLEFLEGFSLSCFIDDRSRRLGLSDVLRVGMHVGAALAHMHGQGVMHLDVNPSNIIVVHGRPVMIDLGTARRFDEARPREVSGTDPYIAPEECLRGEVTPAADVFGLAVLVYELLTGALPFGKGARADPFPQTSRAPSPLRTHRPAAPKGLDDLLLSGLARDPRDRPPLPAFLLGLHGYIRAGRGMWPAGFTPEPGGRSAEAGSRTDRREADIARAVAGAATPR